MLQKVFVVGRSGSGKTAAINIIAEYVKQRNISFACHKDYQILFDMYVEDMKQDYYDEQERKFRPAEYGGFEVRTYSAFDTALKKLQNKVKDTLCLDENGVIAIEFARNNYYEVFSKIDQDLLRGAYVLFIDCELNLCIERIYARLTNPPRPDFHFVPDRIMHSYFSGENLAYMENQCKHDFPELEIVKTIDNTKLSFEEFRRQVESFTKVVVDKIKDSTLSTVQPSSARTIEEAIFNTQMPYSEISIRTEPLLQEEDAVPV